MNLLATENDLSGVALEAGLRIAIEITVISFGNNNLESEIVSSEVSSNAVKISSKWFVFSLKISLKGRSSVFKAVTSMSSA